MRLMDYDKFKKEYESFDEYMKQSRKDFILDHGEGLKSTDNIVSFKSIHNDDWIDDNEYSDRVNHPSHYTRGSQEAIVTIEEAIDGADVFLGLSAK